VAAREIHKFQKTTNLLIRKAPFQHVLHKIALKFGKSNLQMQSQPFWIPRRLWNTS
jgi:histone H3/H4